MDDDNDDNIFYGTPLPEYEDETHLRKKAAHELEVRDEKGRKRFHGAFTGGFSAGYFNTVGTKEGWAPSTFVSSRNKTADRIQQNPEDFMDDEDFGAFGIATRKIHAATDFRDSSLDNKKKQNFTNTDSAIPGEAPLRALVQPINESIGIKILKKMGWRQGQGIGPRIKKQSAGVKTYGCSLFPHDTEIEEDDPMMLRFTFAPEDSDSHFFQPKDNCFGLGYTGLSKKSILDAPTDIFSPTSTKTWLSKDKRKLTITGQAFGVGAYEDEDADIYSKDDMSQYDFSDMAVPVLEDPKQNLGSKKQDKSSTIVIEGFCLALKPAIVKKHYRAPELPHNFKPVHAHITKPNAPLNRPMQGLSADCRSLILGEKFRPVDNKIIEKPNMVLNASNKFTSSGFVPFSNDEAKQKRYEQFLKLKSTGEIEKLKKPPSMTEWEQQQELEEFSKAATFFKPLSIGLSLRFESRSQLDVEHEVMGALQKIKSENAEKSKVAERKPVGSRSRKIFEWHPTTLLCKRFNVPNPYPNSDCSGVPNSQKLKRTLFDHLSSELVEKSDKEEAVPVTKETSKCEVDSTKNDVKTSQTEYLEGLIDLPNTSETKSVTHAEVISQTIRPPMDLFKDIFENSSSDEETSPIEDKSSSPHLPTEITEKSSSPNLLTKMAEIDKLSMSNPPVNKNDNDIPKSNVTQKKGFGVFANLDLDALNKRVPVDKTLWHGNTTDECLDGDPRVPGSSLGSLNEHNNTQASSEKIDDNYYGPELPPNYSDVANTRSEKVPKKHVKHKSKHKHKHHKHKSEKKKKKKRSRKDSESDDSSDDSVDIPPALIIEKLKKLKKI